MTLIQHPEIILFYSLCGLLFLYIFHAKLKLDIKRSLVATLAFIFVGSEYYEIPFFIEGYLIGPTPDWLHHIFVIIMFLVLAAILESNLDRINILCLLVGPILTAPILYLLPQYIYYAKVIGFFFLFLAVTTSSDGVRGKNVSKKP